MDAREVRELLDDRPELEAALEEVWSVDRDNDIWSFDDIPVDSGAFGELVGAGLVESVGDNYRLADPDVVETVLSGGTVDTEETGDFEFSLPEFDWTAAGSLTALLVVVVAFRVTTYFEVFRDRIVYPANDPYYYVYHVETGLQNGWNLSNLPGSLETQEPLTLVVMLLSTELTGGFGPHNLVLALLPVVVAVVAAILLYLFACEVTGDRRIALASVVVFAVMPMHVGRTSLGFIDHHAFDAPWLIITAWGLTAALDIEQFELDWPTVRAVALLGIGVAGSVLSWWAAALLLVPIAVTVVVAAALAVRDNEPFISAGMAITTGVGIGTGLIGLAHLLWGWHDTVTVAVPIGLTVGIIGVVGATSAWRHLEFAPWTFPVAGIGGAAAIAVAVSTVAPSMWMQVMDQLTRLFGTRGITQTQSLFGETMGWLFMFGFLLVVSLPAIGWACTRIYTGSRRWIAPTSYGIFLLGLGTIQLRFGGELSPFIALFGGLAIVALAGWIDVARSPVPKYSSESELSMPARGTLARLAIVVVLICGLSAVQAPIAASELTVPEERYETASFINDHATEAGYEYPDSYVFSPWSWNRMYNYYVNGEAGSYGYAQSNYQTFVTLNNATVAHKHFVRSDSYLVTEPVPNSVDIPSDLMQTRLHNRYGSRGDGVSGLDHYRALYASPSGNFKAFRVVPGGTIEGAAEPNTNVTVTTDVDIEGDKFTYKRRATANANGTYSVTVPYPGEYELDGATAESVTINEEAVNNGETVQA